MLALTRNKASEHLKTIYVLALENFWKQYRLISVEAAKVG
jgi:hypothetical protein